jgi:hypothetical protein
MNTSRGIASSARLCISIRLGGILRINFAILLHTALTFSIKVSNNRITGSLRIFEIDLFEGVELTIDEFDSVLDRS